MFDQKTKAILIGGGVSALIAVFPLISAINLLCCAGFIIGGYVAVFYHHKGNKNQLSFSDDALTGLLSGIFAGLLTMMISFLHIQFYGLDTLEKDFQEIFSQLGLLSGDDFESSASFRISELFTFPLVLVYIIFTCLINGFFGMIGGMIRSKQEAEINKTVV